MVRGGIFVSTENNGLRFDIYERVNLPENVAAIEELEEIELVPRIQVIDQGELVLLQGQLVLNGIYRGEGFGQEQIALEHWIPVEISLPMSRVQQLDDITVDIDTFHVEPVSERALNITGVLTLRGIYLEAQEEQQWEQDAGYEEQFNFVAQAEAGQRAVSWQNETLEEEDRDSWFVSSEDAQLESEQLAQEWRDFSESEQLEEEEESEQLEEEEESEQQLEEEVEYEQRLADEVTEQWEQAEIVLTEEEEYVISEQSEEEYVASEDSAQQEIGYVYREEAVEDTTAYAQYTEEQVYYSEADLSSTVTVERESDLTAWQASEPEVAKVTTSFGIKDLLSSSLREQAASELQRLDAERERIQKQLLNEQIQSEQLEWRQMLLQPDGKEQFRKIKMYIVQKNDTLDQIAGKYSVNPRDLLNHNKLHETTISVGQLLYIP